MDNSPISEPLKFAAGRLESVRRTAQALGFQPADSTRQKHKAANGRDPVLLGDVLQDIVESRGWQVPLSVAKLSTIWPEIVGEVAAQNCHVEQFEGHQLKIRAASTNWAVQLRLLEPTIRAKIANVIGKDVVDKIVILGPAPPYVHSGRFSVPGRGWRDTWG
ncbi:MAG: DciA family protein [Cellulomonadaceae bacterium]|jgi:predicted nucleic acid-binding Zn ribbon protein|nr:DciA family protein [Cellulomonadaceae bacterium]